MAKSAVIPLLNSIVDACLVYGIDETSKVLELENSLEWKEGTLLRTDVKLHFLQLIAPGVVYPERTLAPNNDLPQSNAPPVSHSKQVKVEHLGLTWETIETVHWFIYPEGARNSQEEVQPTVIPMLLTNIEGTHTYASGIRFSRPFFIQKPENTHICKLYPWKKTVKEPPVDSKLFYVPTCIVLISKHPYFQFMKDALSGLFRVMVEDGDIGDFWECLHSFMHKLFLVPSPPPDGQLPIQVLLPGFQSPLLIRPPKGGLYLDIRLHYPFLSLSVDNVLKVFTALILEQRTVFLSTKFPLLTYTIQCFLYYLNPFEWRSPCVPILPHQVLEYLEAPGVYIMGCQSKVKETSEFQSLIDVVVVNLDTDQVIYQQMEVGALPALPKAAADTFRKSFELLSRAHFTIDEAHRLSPSSAGEVLKERETFEYLKDTELSRIFLELMVNLFDYYSDQLQHSRAKYDEIISKTDQKDQDFYKMACNTDMFSGFCQCRHRGTQRGEFAVLAERMRREKRKKLTLTTLEASTTVPSLRHSASAPGGDILSSMSLTTPSAVAMESTHTVQPSQQLYEPSQSDQSVFELPSLVAGVDRAAFIRSAIDTLEELCVNKKDKKLSAPSVCLLGFYKIAQGNIIGGCDDLFDILRRLDIHLVPGPSIIALLKPYIATMDKEFKSRSYFSELFSKCNRVVSSRHSGESQSAIRLTNKLPTSPLGLTEFLQIVKQNNLVSDNDSATSLHYILAEGRSSSLAPEGFANFYETWKAVNSEIKRMTELLGQLERTDRANHEVVLAVSDPVKSSFASQGQLVITTYRVLIVTPYRVYSFADLRKKFRFEKYDVRSGLLSGTRLPAIRAELMESVDVDITMKRRHISGDIYVTFATPWEQEGWLKMIAEMQRGLDICKARRDPQLIELAQTRVTLCSVILQCGVLERCSCSAHRTKLLLKLMTLQSKNEEEITEISTGLTVDSLQYRINPCSQEAQTQSVESILYIPSAEPADGLGKLWIGLGNGRLKVYDMEHRCFESDINITESRCGKSVRLSCLLLVKQHVWVGSLASSIHIMDAETVCHVSQLSYLEDTPRGMVLSKSEPQRVWILLLNGVLLAYDPETRTRTAKLQISNMSPRVTCTCFTIADDFLWVGTNQGTIAILDTQKGVEVSSINLATPDTSHCQVEIKDIAISAQNQIWCSIHTVPRTPKSDYVAVIDQASHEVVYRHYDLNGRVSVIVPVQSTMWCGTKTGKLYIFNTDLGMYTKHQAAPRCLAAHDDFIRTIAVCGEGFVVSGSGSKDGHVAVWKVDIMPW